jgi:TonB-linked SusC/RagA family outer membrane protein
MTYIKALFFTLFLILPQYFALAQDTLKVETTTITGVVHDAETGNPIPFASITDGSFSSVFTEIEGTFSIKVKTLNDILTISLLGYIDKDVPVSEKTHIDIYLKSIGLFSYQNKVNTGYDVNKLAYTSQAVSATFRNDNMDKAGSLSAESVFKGNIAGLRVTQRNGAPGSGSELSLRGFSSLNATNRPLIIVDGMIFDTQVYGSPLISGFDPNPLNDIDVSDIESVTVVKDAVSVYGAKAANGVIYIQTKRAKEQATKIELHTYGGAVFAPKNIPVLNADDYRLYLNDAVISSGKTISDFGLDAVFNDNITTNADYYRYHNNTNWQKEVFNNGYCSNYNLNIRGGDDIILLGASVSYSSHNGNIKNTDYSRFNIRLNADINVSKIFAVSASFSFIKNQRDLLSGSSLFDNDDPLYMSLIKAPFTYPYIRTESGIITPNLENYDLLNVSNPVALVNNMEQKSSNYRLFGNFDFILKLNKNLTISNLIGISADKNFETIFVPKQGVVPVELALGVGNNRMANRVLRHNVYNNDFRIKYIKSFSKHNINLLAGARLNYNKNEEDWVKDYNSANDDMRTVGNGILLYAQNGGLIGNWTNITYYATAGYDYNKKYFLSVSSALDGSSRFGKEADGIEIFGAKFGFFPSVSGAWLVSSEPFMANIHAIDFLKLRASYGITGNDDIGNYSSQKTYTSRAFLGYPGLLIGNLWNPKLKWETNKKMNFGLDLSVLKERLSVSIDYYNNKTEDMLFYRPVDVYTGFSYYTENNGGFTTKGIDLAINGRIINKPVKWDMGLTLSKYKTEVNSIYGNSYLSEVMGANVLTEVGKPLGVFYGYKTKGVFATQDQATQSGLKALMPNTTEIPFTAGDVIFDDRNPDGVIKADDQQVIGDPNPDFFGELNTRVQWKSISLEAAISFCYGNDIFNYMRYKLEAMSGFENQTQAVLNRWRYDGQVTNIPKASYGDPMGNARFSDRWIEDGSYARLRYLTISYRLPMKWNIVKSSEVYVSGINLVTLTKYKGFDPEFSYSGYSLSKGIDPGMTPQSKAVYIGLKIGL